MLFGGIRKYALIIAGIGLATLYFQYDANIIEIISHHKFHQKCGVECIDGKLDVNPPDEFLIHTPTCKIPNFPITHPSIIKYKRDPITVNCSHKLPLTEDNDRLVTFHLDRAWQYGFQNWDQLNCSYQGIIRVSDRRQKLKESIPILKPTIEITDENAIALTCYEKNSSTKVVYKNMHYFIQPFVYEEKEKIHKSRINSKDHPLEMERLNAMVLGKDAVSRGNLMRHMPKTYEYITKVLGGIDFKGFNKVGENTFPNVFATMSGIPVADLGNTSCSYRAKAKLDDCPFLWKNYSQKNYLTYYLEDAPGRGIFRFYRSGFEKQQTDIYNSPYCAIADAHIGHSSNVRGVDYKICQGGKTTSVALHDYNFKISKTLKDKVPFFGFMWDSTMTHDKLALASAIDSSTMKALADLKKEGILDKTFLVFMSDHGIRYMSIRRTYAGMLEERLPFLIVVPPPWFKDKYPEAYKNLLINSRRLVSNLDIHGTLQDLHGFGYTNPAKSFVGEKYGQSLFKEVPLNRTCPDLAIRTHFCACQNSTEINKDDPILWNAARQTIIHLNKGLAQFTKCVPLALDKVLSGRVSTASDNTKPSLYDTVVKKYLVVFSAKPSGALLESSVWYDSGNFKVFPDISRINLYGNQSHCITDLHYRKYCYCRDFL